MTDLEQIKAIMLARVEAEVVYLTIEKYFAEPSPFGPNANEQPKQIGWGLRAGILVKNYAQSVKLRRNCQEFMAERGGWRTEFEWNLDHKFTDEFIVTVVMKFWEQGDV